MSFKSGLQALVDKVPEIATPRGFLRGLLTVLVALIVPLIVLLVADRIAPWLGLVVQVLVFVGLYLLLRQFFGGREARLTYTDAFYGRFLPSVGLNLASLGYILFNGGGVPAGVEPTRFFPLILSAIAVIYLLVTSALIFVRAIQVAGVDSLAGVYVYFPDEGRRLESGLYGVMRHPVYAAFDRLVLAFALWNGSAYALLLGLIFIAVWHPVWIKIEEAELRPRLGKEYEEYAASVPAVCPHGLSGEATLWQVLTGRVAAEQTPELTDEGGSSRSSGNEG
jgi:protein-S-isoprenylcysteine O-methyltransferase Ste14